MPDIVNAERRAKIEADWRRRGFSSDIWVDAPGQVWENFVHTADELVMPIEGAIELEFLDRTLRPAIGEEVLIPAGAAHTLRNVGAVVSRWLYGYRRTGAP